MIVAVVSFFGSVVSAVGTAFSTVAGTVSWGAVVSWAFVVAWWPEILIALAVTYMVYLIMKHGKKRGWHHPHFEWAKIAAEAGHVARHPSWLAAFFLAIGLLTAIFSGHDNHRGDGPPSDPPTHQV